MIADTVKPPNPPKHRRQLAPHLTLIVVPVFRACSDGVAPRSSVSDYPACLPRHALFLLTLYT